jgi:uncharacterized protein YebE (UPF0316 family)
MAMLTFTATDAKNNFGVLTDTALTQPVSITRRGRVILEVMTPQAKEAMIQDRIKELAFGQFVADAVEADKEYTETGLHTTQAEMRAWAKNLKTNPNAQMPVCHK